MPGTQHAGGPSKLRTRLGQAAWRAKLDAVRGERRNAGGRGSGACTRSFGAARWRLPRPALTWALSQPSWRFPALYAAEKARRGAEKMLYKAAPVAQVSSLPAAWADKCRSDAILGEKSLKASINRCCLWVGTREPSRAPETRRLADCDRRPAADQLCIQIQEVGGSKRRMGGVIREGGSEAACCETSHSRVCSGPASEFHSRCRWGRQGAVTFWRISPSAEWQTLKPLGSRPQRRRRAHHR